MTELSENLREQMAHATRYQGTTEVVYQRLKPCPFCGESDAEAVDHYEAPEDPEQIPVAVRVVMCGVCGAMGPAKDSHQDEIAYWNERAK